MIGLWILMLRDLEGGLEIVGEDDWCAVRFIIRSPLLGVGAQSGWVAIPLDAP